MGNETLVVLYYIPRHSAHGDWSFVVSFFSSRHFHHGDWTFDEQREIGCLKYLKMSSMDILIILIYCKMKSESYLSDIGAGGRSTGISMGTLFRKKSC